ncbi:MAG: 23S rRNA (pseudouridine(1915)-N(3))-methyltransferase RlmH [Bacillota bacterium]
MSFNIIAVGKLKEKYWRDAAAEYLKRLQPYARITITELPDEQVPAQASSAEIAAIKEKEAQKIIAAINDNHYVIALDPAGERISSEGLAAAFDSLAVRGHSRITFIIGGAAGLAPSVIERADRKLSFSDLTFTHQMIRIILLEQIYRAFKISRGEKYHL